MTNYYYISWDYYLPLTVYIVNSSFHKSRSVNVTPCYLRRDLCHFVLANSGPLSLEKLMLCKSTDKMHSFNRRLSTQVCSCKEIKTLLSLEMWVHDKPQWQHCWGNFTCKITQYIHILWQPATLSEPTPPKQDTISLRKAKKGMFILKT